MADTTTVLRRLLAVTTPRPTGTAGTFTMQFEPYFCVGEAVNGGVVQLAMTRVAQAVAPQHPDLISLKTNYLAKTDALVVATLTAEPLKASGSFAHVRVSLQQSGAVCAFAVVTLGRLDKSKATGGPSFTFRPKPAPFAATAASTERDTQPLLPFVGDMELRDLRQPAPGLGVPASYQRILMVDAGAPLASHLLAFLVDAFEPAMFALDPEMRGTVWCATMDLMTQVFRRPAAGPLLVRYFVNRSDSGFHQADAEIWDSDNELVATSRQSAITVPFQRSLNTKSSKL